MNPLTFFAGVLILATAVEGFVEYAFGTAVKVQPYLKYIALTLGVGVAIAYHVDIFATIGLISPVPFVGYILSGLIIGRGSNYVNDFVTGINKPVPVVINPSTTLPPAA